MNYEEYKNAIDKRISNRRFTGSPIGEEKLRKLQEIVDSYNKESGLSMQLIIGDSAPFDGKQASGLFQGTAGYLALIGKKGDPDRMEKEGYYGEMFVLEATLMGLGTCWVASSFGKDKSKAHVGEDEILDLAIAFGYAEKKLSIKEKMIRMVLGKKQRTIEDVAPNVRSAPDWFRNGVNAVMKAPSTKNTRAFCFLFRDNIAIAQTVGNHERVMVDLGIAKLHFKIGVSKGEWELGNNAAYNQEAHQNSYVQ